jgi:DNA helicase HerA-like ATPase
MYEIIIGRSPKEQRLLGTKGTILLGKHYVQMERELSLANPIHLDINKPHAILVAGKRGSGKSYTLGVMAEGIAELEPEIKQNISTIIFDTMGIYWSMKNPNLRDAKILSEWKLEPKAADITIYSPIGKFDEYQKEGFPVDKPLAIKPNTMSAKEWSEIFKIDELSMASLLLERAIAIIQEDTPNFSLNQLMKSIKSDKDADEKDAKLILSKLRAIKKWGIFDEEGTNLVELTSGGQTAIIDLSPYAESDDGDMIRALIISHICNYVIKSRMSERRREELKEISGDQGGQKAPLLWILIDEAHEFLPLEGETLASGALRRILKEGRQPGISLILATQQPGKIDTDVMTQSDIVISHRLTSNMDLKALNEIMQSYLTTDLQKNLDSLPRVGGSAIILDDTNEKIMQVQIRPRNSWHGGSNPNAIPGAMLKSLVEAIKEKGVTEENKAE